MTPQSALYQWFNKLGIPFYVNTSVPDDVKYPYGTYQSLYGSTGDEMSMTVMLYYYSTKETDINAMASAIEKKLRNGGVQIPCDEGSIWLTKGIPFCQAISNDTDSAIKERYINMNVSFLLY